MTDESTENYIKVDVEDKRHLVRVYDQHGKMPAIEFVSSHHWAETPFGGYSVTLKPYDAACAYAKRWARELKCDWGANA